MTKKLLSGKRMIFTFVGFLSSFFTPFNLKITVGGSLTRWPLHFHREVRRERPVLVIFKNWQWFSRVQLNSFMLPLMWHEPDHIPTSIRKKKNQKAIYQLNTYNLETWFLYFWNQMIRTYDMSRMIQEKRILPGSLNRAQLFL